MSHAWSFCPRRLKLVLVSRTRGEGARCFSTHRSILFRDRWAGRHDVSVPVSLHEVTVGNPDRDGIVAGEDIHSVVILPERSHLHQVQALGLPEEVEDLFADEGVQHRTLV